MTIEQKLLTPNTWSRPRKKIKKHLGIVMHWTGGTDLDMTWKYFESKKTGTGGYGSAHYIIGKNGDILQCIPTDEIAYHVGSAREDPKSKKIYTDYAREKFGEFAENPEKTSPNFCTIGIEMCPADEDGELSSETLFSATELCVSLCMKYALKAADITTHNAIVGWKDCPKLWVEKPELFEAFRNGAEYILKNQFKV